MFDTNEQPDTIASAVEFRYRPAMPALLYSLVQLCRLLKSFTMEEKTCRVVGRIVNCAADESVLTGGKPDAEKMKPLCFDPCGHVYRIMGEAVEKAFSCGKTITDN